MDESTLENCLHLLSPFSAAACLCMAAPELLQRKARGLVAETASFPEQDHNLMLIESCPLWFRQEGKLSQPPTSPQKQESEIHCTEHLPELRNLGELSPNIALTAVSAVNPLPHRCCNSSKGKRDLFSSLPHLHLKEQQSRHTWGELHGFPIPCSRGHGLTQGLVGAQRLLRAGFP